MLLSKRERSLKIQWRKRHVEVICYQYVIVGHFASNCPDGLLKLQETQENDNNDTKEADEHMMQEAVYLNEKNVLPNM